MTSTFQASCLVPVFQAGAVLKEKDRDSHNSQNHNCISKISAWSGRSISLIENGAKSISCKIVHLAQNVLVGLSALCEDTNALAALFRKLDKHVLRMFEQTARIPGYFDKFADSIRSTTGVIDFVQVAADADYFFNGKFKDDNKLSISAKIALTITDVGGSLLWLEEMSFFTLSKAAASIGNVRIFSFVPKLISSIPVIRDFAGLQRLAATIGNARIFSWISKISLGFIVERALTIGYLFLAAESIQRLIQPGNSYQKTQASLDLASYVSELALDALLTIGVTSVIGLGAVGSVCITFALSSFAYKLFHQDELKKLPEQETQVANANVNI